MTADDVDPWVDEDTVDDLVWPLRAVGLARSVRCNGVGVLEPGRQLLPDPAVTLPLVDVTGDDERRVPPSYGAPQRLEVLPTLVVGQGQVDRRDRPLRAVEVHERGADGA